MLLLSFNLFFYWVNRDNGGISGNGQRVSWSPLGLSGLSLNVICDHLFP